MMQIFTPLSFSQLDPMDLTGWYFIKPDDRLREAFESYLQVYVADPVSYEVPLRELFDRIQQHAHEHLEITPDDLTNDMLVEIGWLSEAQDHLSDDYVTAQLMGYAHLLSWHFVRQMGAGIRSEVHFIDPRDLFITDDNWLDARIDQAATDKRLSAYQQQTEEVFITAWGVGIDSMNEMTVIKDTSQYTQCLA